MSQRGLFYGWVILAATTTTAVAIEQGALFSLGIFLEPLEESMHWSRSAISLIVTREYFGERVMGSGDGAVFLVSALGMGTGSWSGAFIHDALGTYAWLFISSAAIGVMAMIRALLFRPPRLAAAPVPVPAAS
jgi:hypothetical protein